MTNSNATKSPTYSKPGRIDVFGKLRFRSVRAKFMDDANDRLIRPGADVISYSALIRYQVLLPNRCV